MGWLQHRNNVLVASALTAAFLFGFGSSFGLGLFDVVFGIKVAYIFAAVQIYIAIALWKRYL